MAHNNSCGPFLFYPQGFQRKEASNQELDISITQGFEVSKNRDFEFSRNHLIALSPYRLIAYSSDVL